jgi:hypothetical protein
MWARKLELHRRGHKMFLDITSWRNGCRITREVMFVWYNIRRVGVKIVVVFCVCVSVALVNEHTVLMGRTILSSVSCLDLPDFLYYIIKCTIFIKQLFDIKSNKFLNNFCQKHSRSENNWDIIVNVYISIYVEYPLYLSYFNDTWIFSNRFSKNNQI